MYLLHLTAVQFGTLLHASCLMPPPTPRTRSPWSARTSSVDVRSWIQAGRVESVEGRFDVSRNGARTGIRHRKHTRDYTRDSQRPVLLDLFSWVFNILVKESGSVRQSFWMKILCQNPSGSKFRLVSSSGGVLSRPLEDLTRIKTRNDVNIDVGVKFGESQTIPVKISLTEWVSMCPL